MHELWHLLYVLPLAALYGIFVGSIPGLTATMAVALMVPLTFFLEPTTAIAAIVTVEACSIFAGDIPGTLVRIPGTPSSAAYTNDAYALTQRGESEQALGISLAFSVVGGLLGAVVLVAAAPQLAQLAERFSSYEYFWLIVLGLSCAAIVSHGSRLKGALALFIGLLFSTVGLSNVHSVPRFTFGQDELLTGINFIPAMIGLFGVSEVLRNVLVLPDASVGSVVETNRRPLLALLRDSLLLPLKRWLAMLRSSSIGALVGMLPGAGADIAAWISYAISKRFSREPDEYGKGSREGIADATGANNAALAGAWIPALVFGIPGDSVTAIVIGVLMMKNVKPGPDIFTEQANLVYGIYGTFFVANLILIPIGLLAIRAGSFLIRVPTRILMPVILLFSMVGAYAISGSYFDIWVMLGMGILGFVLEKYQVPLGPVVLGIILGGQLEERFIQCMTKSDSLADFFTRPISAVLGLMCLALWVAPLIATVRKRVS